MIGWIVETSKKNHWRVASWYELRDLIQDGYMVYARCNETYAHIRKQSHFMALFKTSFKNHIHNLAKLKSRTVDFPISLFVVDDTPDWTALDVLAGPQPEEATFRVLLTQLPTELKALLLILAKDARNIPKLRRENRTRETLNEYLCRLIGRNPEEYDIEALLVSHFSGQQVRMHRGLSFWL